MQKKEKKSDGRCPFHWLIVCWSFPSPSAAGSRWECLWKINLKWGCFSDIYWGGNHRRGANLDACMCVCVCVSSSVCVLFSSSSWFIQKGGKQLIFFPYEILGKMFQIVQEAFFSSPRVGVTSLNSWLSKPRQKSRRAAFHSGTNAVLLHLKISLISRLEEKRLLHLKTRQLFIVFSQITYVHMFWQVYTPHTRLALIFARQFWQREASRSRSIMHLNNIRKKKPAPINVLEKKGSKKKKK